MNHTRRRILIVDDSAYSRRALKNMIEEFWPATDFEYASAGEEGLQLALAHEPDIIFLDLEMPRMDGFTFLRLLMAKRPTPVVIVSSRDDHASLLKALDLGAVDFIAKPTQQASARIYEIQAILRQKLEGLATARPARSEAANIRTSLPAIVPEKALPEVRTEPTHLICIGASTGGPGTISRILARLQLRPWVAAVVVQHMPAGFTAAFAERLDRALPFPVREIRHLDRVEAGGVYVCPGGANVEVSRGRDLRFRLSGPDPSDRYVPSIDRFFASAAREFSSRTATVVLTGMGNDGTAGARIVRAAGGLVLAQDPQTAIVFGMPSAVIDAGLAHTVLATDAIAGAIDQWSMGILRTGK